MSDKTGPKNCDLMVSGPDATTFLQGQLTADVDALDGAPALAAWCNPKGRVIVVMQCRREADQFRLRMPADIAESVNQRLMMFRFRAKVEFDLIEAADEDLAAALRAGVPRIGCAQSEQFTPHMLNLDLQNAISFDKGCYTGQEVVARTHYRGATKRRMLRFSGAEAAPGDRLMLDERAIGDVVNSVGDSLLAVLPLEHADARLDVNGNALRREALPYLPD